MIARKWLAWAGMIPAALGAAACGSSTKSGASAGTINGAGSTFAAPIYQEWGSRLKGDQGLTVNYQSVGSGAGVAQFTAGTVDFGATDPPLKDQEIAAARKRGSALDIPMAFGAITVSYNLPGIKSGLRLDGATVADIYRGRIARWNDPRIARLNPGVKLPAQAIRVVHRSDESGTTKGFTAFLSAYSKPWASAIGSDKTVKWPTGTGAKGNEGVAAAVKQTPGSIGYVEEAYALQNGFTTASVKNRSGRFVAPTLASTTAAGEGIKVPSDLRFTIIDSPNPAAYPIASQTFVVVYRDLCRAGLSRQRARGVARFLGYGLGDGQKVLSKLDYGTLPAALDARARAKVARLRCHGKPLQA